jgi:hypothetical protein
LKWILKVPTFGRKPASKPSYNNALNSFSQLNCASSKGKRLRLPKHEGKARGNSATKGTQGRSPACQDLEGKYQFSAKQLSEPVKSTNHEDSHARRLPILFILSRSIREPCSYPPTAISEPAQPAKQSNYPICGSSLSREGDIVELVCHLMGRT